MKTAIIYYSKHHQNTKKLVNAIAKQEDVTLFPATAATALDLSGFDLIGFASGIYYQKFHKNILTCAQKNLPPDKDVFLLYTYGAKRDAYTHAIRQIVLAKGGRILGSYGCLGFDTFGPFSLIGGIAKGRPNEEDIAKAVQFFQSVQNDYANSSR